MEKTSLEEQKPQFLSLGGGIDDWDAMGVADPYVIEFGGKLYMYYLGMDKFDVQRLGVAVSEDGEHWLKYAKNPIMDVGVKGSFDEGGLGEPSVIYQNPYFYMIYTGRNSNEERNIGIAISLDGVSWKKMNYEGIAERPEDGWDSQVVCDTTLLQEDTGDISIWYGGGNIPSPDEKLNGCIGKFESRFDKIIDEVGFDVNSEWDEMPVSSIDFLKGSYGIEGESPDQYVWMSDEAGVILSNLRNADKIIINGYMPLEMHKQAGVVENVELFFYLNGEVVESRLFASSEIFEIELRKPDELKGNYFEIEIKASSVVNPKNSMIGEDERDLSWMLYQIEQRRG